MAVAEHNGKRVEYVAFPHPVGGGAGYDLRLGPKDIVHVELALGSTLTDEQIVARAAYWRLVMERQAARRA